MSTVYFGQMRQYIQSDYAPTGRASCKSCKEKIEKDSLRIGKCMDDDHYSGKNWYHLDCFSLDPRFKEIKPQTDVHLIDQLDKEDYGLVVKYIGEEVERLNAGGKKKKVSKKTKKKEKQQEKTEDKQQEKQQQKKTQATSKSKGKKKRNASSTKKTKKKVSSGYTQAQKTQFQQLLSKYMKNTSDNLKNVLAANNQSRTGQKQQLAQKCADGELLGKIPMCPECGGGKLRFDRKTGIYKCPGYMDDDQFKNCNSKRTLERTMRDK